MIRLTRLNDKPFVVNAELIKSLYPEVKFELVAPAVKAGAFFMSQLNNFCQFSSCSAKNSF